MVDSKLLIAGSAILIGLVWLGAWIFKKIRRGEIVIGFHTALLALLVAILVVPFAMNFSAHLLSNAMQHSSGAQHAGQPEDLAPAHRHDSL